MMSRYQIQRELLAFYEDNPEMSKIIQRELDELLEKILGEECDEDDCSRLDDLTEELDKANDRINEDEYKIYELEEEVENLKKQIKTLEE